MNQTILSVQPSPADVAYRIEDPAGGPGAVFVGDTLFMSDVGTVAAQRADNIHVREGVDEDQFAALRRARGAALAMPALMLPSVL